MNCCLSSSSCGGGVVLFANLSESERSVLEQSVKKVQWTDKIAVCEQHISFYTKFAQPAQKKSRQQCHNPFNKHSDTVVGISAPSKAMTSSAILKPRGLTRDVLLCKVCYAKCNLILNGASPEIESSQSSEELLESQPQSSQEVSGSQLQSSEEVFMGSQPSTSKEVLNSCLHILGLKGIELKNKHQRENYAQQIVQDVCKVVDMKVREVLDLPGPSVSDAENEFPSSDFKELMLGLRSKFSEASKIEKLQMLTLKPDSWSTKTTASFFNVSENFVRRAKQVKSTGGLLATPPKPNARKLSAETIALVKRFFEDDEISRQLPGMKEKIAGQQKRLILGNLSEVFSEFKKAYPNIQIGKSSFAALRPKWCVWPGASGTHTVCVCVKHQNFKLLCTAAQLPKDCYKEFIASSVCSEPDENCHLGECPQCPNLDGVYQQLDSHWFFCFTDQAEEQEKVNILQWESVDRGELSTQTLTKVQLRDKIAKDTLELREHHYVAKEQARYFKMRKENLQENEAVIVMDFAENFAFELQESSQASYFHKQQATVFVAVVYTRNPVPDMPPVAHSYIFVSDYLEHTTGVVHNFQKKLVQEIIRDYPQVKKLLWFSDGARQHFKNLKGFRNLAEHKKEFFGLEGEWSFFATAHGKGSCDGVGGAFKLSVYRYNMKIRPNETPLRNAHEMAAWAQSQTDSKIEKVFFVPKSELAQYCKRFERKHQTTMPFKGSSKCHHFVPGSADSTIKGFRTSFSTDHVEREIVK
jgi:hypothetical protein